MLEQLEREKGIDKEILIAAVKHALVVAVSKVNKINPIDTEVKVEIDRKRGDIHVYIAGNELPSKNFGRIAAQTAKQVIVQKIREIEKDNIYNEFKDKIGSIISGVVYRTDNRMIVVDILGRAEGIIPQSFLSPLDRIKMGEHIKALVYDVRKDKGSQIILSRRHEGLVKKLFEMEVPEISDGIVEIKYIAREAGGRTKIAVFSKDDKVDCVGACVGMRGSRVKNIIDELRGEKIDIVRWHDDIKEFVKAALSPAVVSKIELDRDNKHIKALVANDQLSLAIGRGGQNVRLASKLVGWEIDVRSKEAIEEDIKKLAKVNKINKSIARVLVDAGYFSVSVLSHLKNKDLVRLKGIGKKKAKDIIEETKKIMSEK